MKEPEFRQDLFKGTARDYDRFRVPYPSTLIDDLLSRAEVTGTGRLLDLACGTGQISFAIHSSFEEVWAVDQEQDMIGVGRENAEEAGVRNMRFLTSSAEDLIAPEESFDLVAIGNAFHRPKRPSLAPTRPISRSAVERYSLARRGAMAANAVGHHRPVDDQDERP